MAAPGRPPNLEPPGPDMRVAALRCIGERSVSASVSVNSPVSTWSKRSLSDGAEGNHVPEWTEWIKHAADVDPCDLEIALSCLDRGEYDAALAQVEGDQSGDEAEGDGSYGSDDEDCPEVQDLFLVPPCTSRLSPLQGDSDSWDSLVQYDLLAFEIPLGANEQVCEAVDVKHALMKARLADEGSSALEALTSAWNQGAARGPDDAGPLQAFIPAAPAVKSAEDDLEHARANTETDS